MRRDEKEIGYPREVRAILERARVVRVAMVDGARPYLVPLSFALDGDDLVLHSAQEGRKLDVLRRNPPSASRSRRPSRSRPPRPRASAGCGSAP
jgi:uncharacterized protein